MRHPIRRPVHPRFSPSLGVAAIVALALSGCSKPPEPQVADGVSREDYDRLEKEVAKMRETLAAADRAVGGAGLEAADLGTRLLRQDARILALEQELAAAKLALMGSALANGDGGAAAPSAPDGASTSPDPIAPADGGPEATFTPEQVATARRMMDAVDRIKSQERQAEMLKRGLARMNISLTPQQEEAVIALNSKYQEKMREVFTGGGLQRTEEDRLASQDKMETLRSAWENDLRNAVPADVADKLIETSGRNGMPGFMPRRIDGTRRSGMTDTGMGNG